MPLFLLCSSAYCVVLETEIELLHWGKCRWTVAATAAVRLHRSLRGGAVDFELSITQLRVRESWIEFCLLYLLCFIFYITGNV